MKKWLFIGALIALAIAAPFIPKAWAAIGFDSSTGTQNVNLTTVDTSITVTSSQINRILLVGVFGNKGSALNVNSVQYGGQTLIREVSTTNNTAGSSTFNIFYLLNPISGTNNVTTTFSASASVFEICVGSFYGVNQTTPIDSTSSVTGTGNSNITQTITTNNPNEWIVDSVGDNAGAANNLGVGTGQTAPCTLNTGGEHGGMSYKALTSAVTTSTFWTGASSTWGGVAVALEQANAATPDALFFAGD